jgi:hypothetical protein
MLVNASDDFTVRCTLLLYIYVFILRIMRLFHYSPTTMSCLIGLSGSLLWFLSSSYSDTSEMFFLLDVSYLQVKHIANHTYAKYSVIQNDGLNFVRLYFLNYTWYVNDLRNI